MNEMFASLKEKVVNNKATLIKAGSIVAGALLGALVASALSPDEEYIYLEGEDANLPELAVGSLVRILPNHACATASQFDCYHVLGEKRGLVSETWTRFSGW